MSPAENLRQAQITEKRYFCFHCGCNGKTKLRRLSVSNKTFFVCPDCYDFLGGEVACLDEFKKNYNPAESFSMSNLQLTTFCRHLKRRIDLLEQKKEAVQ